MNLTSKLFDSLSNEAIHKLKKAMYRCVDLIESFFPDPDDVSKKIVLYQDQRDAIDTIQYGYPLSKFRFGEIEKMEQPGGGILMARRQVGKSILCGYSSAGFNIIGAGFPDYSIPCYCGIIAASEDESFELIDKTKLALNESEFKEFIHGRPKKDRIDLKNGSQTRAHPCSEKSIRGKKYHVLFIDEGRWMDEKVLFEAALPTVEHGYRWFAITTPQGTKGRLTSQYLKAISERPVICTECLQVYKQKDFLNAEFPTKNQIWIMPKLGPCKICGSTHYKYGHGYIATPWIDPWNCPIIDPIKLKKKLDYYSWSPWARQEWLGELIDEASMIILKEWIDNSTNPKLRLAMRKVEGVSYVLGLDFGRLHDETVFTIIHRNPNTNRILLDYMRSVSGRYDIETDWDGIHNHAKEIFSFFKPTVAVIDSTSMGYREVEAIQKELKNWSPGTSLYNSQKNWWKLKPERRRLGFWFDRINKPQLIGNLKALLSTNPPVLEIPPASEPEIDELITEFLRFECVVHQSGYIEYGTQDYNDDRLISYALALWGLTEKTRSIRSTPKGVKFSIAPKEDNPGIDRYNRVLPKLINIDELI